MERLQAEIDRLKISSQNNSAETDALSAELNEARDLLNGKQQELADLQSDIGVKTEALENARAELSALKDARAEAENRQEELNEMQLRISEMQSRVDETAESLRKAQLESQEKQNEIEARETELNENTNDKEKE